MFIRDICLNDKYRCTEMQEKMEYNRTGVAENFRECGHFISSIISFALHFLYTCTSTTHPSTPWILL